MTIWRTIVGFPKYEVSEDGKIRRAINDIWRRKSRVKPGQLLKGRKTRFGYTRYELKDEKGKSWTVMSHHAIALGFCGPRPSKKHQALHWDDNPEHNHVRNIRWGSNTDNSKDAIRNGRVLKGEDNPMAALTNAQAKEIRAKYKGQHNHPTLKELGAEYGVSLDTIHHVIRRKGSYRNR